MSNPPYSLRPATAADYDFLFALHRETMQPYIDATWGWVDEWQEEYFRKKFDPASRQIVQINGQDAGVLVVEDHGSSLYLALIEIGTLYQRQGVGSAIVRSLQQRAEREQRPLHLHVLKANLAARHLYETLGFTITGEEPVRWQMTYFPTKKPTL